VAEVGPPSRSVGYFFFSIPEIVFEAAITIYTIVKGFRPSQILDDTPPAERTAARRPGRASF
jgi:hypothetical protein